MRRLTEEHRRKIGEALQDRSLTVEHKANISKGAAIRVRTVKGHKQVKEAAQKAKAARTGSKHTEETKAKMREAHHRRLKDPKARESMLAQLKKGWTMPCPESVKEINRKRMTGRTVTAGTRAKLAEVRSRHVMPLKDTKPERLVQAFLRMIGVEYEAHKIVSGLGLHQWDIVLERQKILIEIDGCYWHGCGCLGRELTATQKAQQKKDRKRTRRAESKGWRVIRVWEHEVLDGLAGTRIAGLSSA